MACYSQPRQSNYYKVERKELHYANKQSDNTVSYPLLTGEEHRDVLKTINQFLQNKFVPTDSVIQSITSADDKEEEDDDDWHEHIEEFFGVEDSTNKYLCISYNYTADATGAAHGSWWSEYYHFDMQTGKQLNFNDLFEDGIYDVIRKTILADFTFLPKERIDTFDAHSLVFQFYIATRDCDDNGSCLVIYFPPYTDVGDLSGAGYIGMNYTIAEKEYAPFVKSKWKDELTDN
ncbi:MAG: hypothetical protein KDC07_04120 [Chitinophagaceae bacterium]|nr:hypothetical protein [Chitinophagaceae bacterium]MCB9047147.1 hypothetical protein [Chitinophagales bacterium]